MIKTRKFKSLLGKQDDLVEDTTYEVMPEYMNIGNGVYVRRNRTTASIVPHRFNLPLDTTHTYFIGVMFNETLGSINMYNYNADGSGTLTTITNKVKIDSFVGGVISGISKIDTIHFYYNFPSTTKPLYAFYVDLTEYGLDTLTPQEFYDRYNSIFEDIAGNKLSIVKKIYTNVNRLDVVKKIYTKFNGEMAQIYNILPSEYQEVEYLGYNNTNGSYQYIDTGIICTTTSGLTVYIDVEGENQSNNGILVSANSGSTGGHWFGSGSSHYWTSGSGAESNVPSTTRIQTTITFGTKVEWTLNGITYSRRGDVPSTSDTTTIGFNKATYHFRGKLYACKIWNNGKLQRSYIPCYRKSDNVIGMYDLVSGQFFINAGTGAFSKGPDVE